jgi:TRAP-type mannitol/chloroaromatic compound transport system permease small subunit
MWSPFKDHDDFIVSLIMTVLRCLPFCGKVVAYTPPCESVSATYWGEDGR